MVNRYLYITYLIFIKQYCTSMEVLLAPKWSNLYITILVTLSQQIAFRLIRISYNIHTPYSFNLLHISTIQWFEFEIIFAVVGHSVTKKCNGEYYIFQSPSSLNTQTIYCNVLMSTRLQGHMIYHLFSFHSIYIRSTKYYISFILYELYE